MAKLRLIARLDIKGPHLIKGVHLEGLRKVGDPQYYARRYYAAGIDEILYMDVAASLYGRKNLTDIVSHTCDDVFVPVTAGGGIRSVEDARELLRAGADKVAVNTAAVARPDLIGELAECFGSQCVVLSIEAKQDGPDSWTVLTDNGREISGRDVHEWAVEGAARGAGEILLTSVDREGTRQGFDTALTERVSRSVEIPVIASGGMGSIDDLVAVVTEGAADAVAMADILHFERKAFADIRAEAADAGLFVRQGRSGQDNVQ